MCVYKVGALITLIFQMMLIAVSVGFLMAGATGTVAVIWIFNILMNVVFGVVNINTILS